MKAAVFHGIGRKLCIEAMPDPTPGPGEVVVKVGRCGICGSDLHMTEDPMFGVPAGAVLGHEFAGEIAAVGKGVEGLHRQPGESEDIAPRNRQRVEAGGFDLDPHV